MISDALSKFSDKAFLGYFSSYVRMEKNLTACILQDQTYEDNRFGNLGDMVHDWRIKNTLGKL